MIQLSLHCGAHRTKMECTQRHKWTVDSILLSHLEIPRRSRPRRTAFTETTSQTARTQATLQGPETWPEGPTPPHMWQRRHAPSPPAAGAGPLAATWQQEPTPVASREQRSGSSSRRPESESAAAAPRPGGAGRLASADRPFVLGQEGASHHRRPQVPGDGRPTAARRQRAAPVRPPLHSPAAGPHTSSPLAAGPRGASASPVPRQRPGPARVPVAPARAPVRLARRPTPRWTPSPRHDPAVATTGCTFPSSLSAPGRQQIPGISRRPKCRRNAQTETPRPAPPAAAILYHSRRHGQGRRPF